MYYLQLVAPRPQEQRPSPRDIVQGPFASANEAHAYWMKLNMWFPEAMRETKYRVTNQSNYADVPREGARGC